MGRHYVSGLCLKDRAAALGLLFFLFGWMQMGDPWLKERGAA